MSKQYNKGIKLKRRLRYVRRLKARRKPSTPAAKPAAHAAS